MRIKTVLAILSALLVSGCGTTTPNIQEFWGTAEDSGHIQRKLVGRISCELRQAVYNLYAKDVREVKDGKHPPRYAFLKDWIAQIVLILTIQEKSSISPQATFVNPMANATTLFSGGRSIETGRSFSWGIGSSWENTATRIDKIHLKYKVSEFLNLKKANWSCDPEPNSASLFISSELHIEDWLRGAVAVAVAEGPESAVEAQAKFAGQADALSHDITFQIVTSGNINAAWKLVRFGSENAPLASASRDRAQQLILTLAPPDKANSSQLGPAGYGASLSSEIGAAIRRETR